MSIEEESKGLRDFVFFFQGGTNITAPQIDMTNDEIEEVLNKNGRIRINSPNGQSITVYSQGLILIESRPSEGKGAGTA